MSIPTAVMPLLEQVRRTLPGRDVPLAFWQLDSGKAILDGFMDLAGRLKKSDIDLELLPKGYEIVALLFSWESECRSEGWGAFENTSEGDFERVCCLFGEVGLERESLSLRAQMISYQADPADIEALVSVGERMRHEYSDDLDRLEYLTQYLCDNADSLLGVHA
jgi:hypothetical protein